MCKEDFDFLWVRTVDFSVLKSIGQSTSLCLELQQGSLASQLLDSFPYNEGQVGCLTLEQTEQSCGASQIVPLVQPPLDFKLDYEILYQLNALVHSQKICVVAANNELMKILNSINVDLAINILQKLHKLKSPCYDPLSFVRDWLERLRGNQNKKRQPSSLKDRNFMRCHRVIVTPSKVYCLGPEIESSNYIVRHYAEYESDFIRLTFVDEDLKKIQSDALTASFETGLFSVPYKTSIYHRILSILRDGIVIGEKRFEFLAFSASQLRSGSVWMFASNGTVNAADIREWMGCFKSIRSISKCAARMGQLFSSSRQIFDVPARDVENIPDVEVTTDGVKYCFSDGIGRISSSFAKQVAKKCGLKEVPSAFQIRYGGYKGVIAVDRNSFRKMSLRKSMQKFDSNNRMLNITSWSESQPCYLNREIITLLSTLGVEDEKFLALQHEQTKLLNKMSYDTEAARKVLEHTSGLDSKHFLVQMLLHGYQPRTEPFLSMMLSAHRDFMVSDMRSKCRIFVPKARVLMGCMDETGTLCYGQVYIRVTLTNAELQCRDQTYFRNVDDKTAIIVGKVVVTKNPCLHPGDIRVLDAVYEPLLEEKGLFDCVLFPQKGPRPHPNECSGGDLDGDLYFTCWDENLVPPETDTPMDYMGRRPRIMDHEVTLEEIQKFFVDYMINDTLGQISIAHLIHADRSPERARSPECIRLANLHSMAVDFAKTGAPAEMPRVLRPKEYPDFMERENKGSYQSTGVLGKLYRTALLAVENPDSNTIPSEKIAKTNYYDPELEQVGFEAFLDAAENYKNEYVKKFIALMNYFGAETEEEILTGNLRNKSMYLQHEKAKYNEMKDRILVSIKGLEREVKGWFEESCNKDEQSRMASAWYHVSYHPNYCKNGTNFLKFPWIVGDILIKIKATARERSQAEASSSAACGDS
ncbi:hypothetical protein Syun_024015 [Stephania yunnanensis]|uniref:RNA-dependent RNA polymerase n=1 Tax=Stephania yunnanensis TaxID=152371 RepID=A0AAP0FB14_9MAGN